MRLFIAIPLPLTLKKKLEQLQESIEGFRWLAAYHMHLTLRFIGETDNQVASLITQALQKIEHPAFNLTCKELGFFPNKSKARILWLGIEPNNSLLKLQADIEELCRHVGLKPDNRKFRPHITLGRNKGAKPPQLQAYVKKTELPEFDAIKVKHFNLYKSTLTPNGSVYKVVKKYPLK